MNSSPQRHRDHGEEFHYGEAGERGERKMFYHKGPEGSEEEADHVKNGRGFTTEARRARSGNRASVIGTSVRLCTACSTGNIGHKNPRSGPWPQPNKRVKLLAQGASRFRKGATGNLTETARNRRIVAQDLQKKKHKTRQVWNGIIRQC